MTHREPAREGQRFDGGGVRQFGALIRRQVVRTAVRRADGDDDDIETVRTQGLNFTMDEGVIDRWILAYKIAETHR